MDIAETLPVIARLAASYSPAHARTETLALLAVDTRLAGIVRSSSEPMLAQLQLAWWRDVLEKPAADRPTGEPLLAQLGRWNEATAGLVELVNGWEILACENTLRAETITALAAARGAAFAALAERIGEPASRQSAERLGRGWALADIAGHLGNPSEQAIALDLARSHDWRSGRLPRAMRPLAVLHALAKRAVLRGEGLDRVSPAAMLVAIRAGLLGG